MKRKANLTIEAELHTRAVRHAMDVHFTDFAGYVTKLIVADIARTDPLTQDSLSRKAPDIPARRKKRPRSKEGPHEGGSASFQVAS